jgi:hypothetical protein
MDCLRLACAAWRAESGQDLMKEACRQREDVNKRLVTLISLGF